MRLLAVSCRVSLRTRRLSLLPPRGGRSYAHSRHGNSGGSSSSSSSSVDDDRRRLRYQTLGEYLQRLPRGIRDVLLWSPAMAAGYFALYKQSVYFVPSARRRLLSRPVDVDDEPQKSGRVVRICRDDATGTVVDGVLLDVVDDVAACSSSSPPIPPFRTGAAMDAGPSCCVLRDAGNGSVVGYTFL